MRDCAINNQQNWALKTLLNGGALSENAIFSLDVESIWSQ
jgi:hypothetical protein